MNLIESNRWFLSEKALGRVMVLFDGDIIIKRNKEEITRKRNRRNEKNGLKVRLAGEDGRKGTKERTNSNQSEKREISRLRVRIINPYIAL